MNEELIHILTTRNKHLEIELAQARISICNWKLKFESAMQKLNLIRGVILS